MRRPRARDYDRIRSLVMTRTLDLEGVMLRYLDNGEIGFALHSYEALVRLRELHRELDEDVRKCEQWGRK